MNIKLKQAYSNSIHSQPSIILKRVWRMPCAGMLRRVALLRTDVSEERVSFNVRVTRIGELGRTLAVTSNWSKLHVLYSSETSVLTRSKRRSTSEDGIFHSHYRENLKSWSEFLWKLPHKISHRNIHNITNVTGNRTLVWTTFHFIVATYLLQ
jgi:hypothetical protein